MSEENVNQESETSDFPVNEKVAQSEFDRFVEYNDLDLEESDLDLEDATQLKKCKDKIIKAIRRGALVVDEKGIPTYTSYHEASKPTDPLTFYPRTGSGLMAADGKKKNHEMASMYAVLGEICKVHPKVFAGLAGPDIKICESMFTLLMD